MAIKTPFMLFQVMRMTFQLTKSSMRKKDAKEKGEMLGKNKRRRATERGKESTDPGKKRRNYSPGWRKQKERGGGKQRGRWKRRREERQTKTERK